MIVKRTTTYAVCPSCGKDAGTVDHLLGIAVVKTAWYCDHCGERYSLDFKADGSVQIEQMPGERIVKTFDVLRLPPQDKDVYFIVSGMRFEPGENHAEYFYESHSCPTNWLRPEMVYHDGDSFVCSRCSVYWDSTGTAHFNDDHGDLTVPLAQHEAKRASDDVVHGGGS